MMKKTRREFLNASGALAATIAGTSRAAGSPALAPPPGEGAGPDLVLVNARVYTVDDTMPAAEDFAVKNGCFLAVGSSSDVRNLATPRTEIIDATGMTVTPRFIDTHSHPSGAGVSELVNVNCDLGSADFVVLAEDPHLVDPDPIKEIGIERTVVGGKTMFSREA